MPNETVGFIYKKDFLLSCLRKKFILEKLKGELGDLPKTLIISAHPDDEIIGAGALVARLKESGPVFVEVTDGAPRDMEDARRLGFKTWQDYARARREELLLALHAAGIASPNLIELGIPDKEAVFNLVKIANKIASIIRELRPEVVLTMPYEGGHPDHDSTCFAVHAAARILALDLIESPPIAEFTSYYAGPGGGMHFDFLKKITPYKVEMTLMEEEIRLKKKMAECFSSQKSVLDAFPLNVEIFREAPLYDFTRQPHEGALYYENQNWGVKGREWRELARKALRELCLRGPI
jgi:LmbE family N-acetylglucosaminyl deacetylase